MTKNVVAVCFSHLYNAFCMRVHFVTLDYVTSVFIMNPSLATRHFLSLRSGCSQIFSIYEEYIFMGCDAA